MNIASWHLEVFEEWGLVDRSVGRINEFIYGGTTENAANVTAATKLLLVK